MFSKKSKFYKLCLILSFLILTSIQVASQINLEWIRRYNPPIQGGNWGNANFIHIDVDEDGSAYVCGPSQNYTYGSDIITIKYNSKGEIVWRSCYNSSTPTTYLNDSPSEMVVDHKKNVIIAGQFSVLSGPSYSEALLIKYSPDGDTLWTKKFKDGLNRTNTFKDLIIDSLNNIYVTGRSDISTADYECVTIKFDEDGNQLWISKHDYYNTLDIVDEICFDPTEEYFYMTSRSGSLGATLKLIKYDCSTGDTLWLRTIPAIQFGNLVTDHSGNIYVSASVSQVHPNRGDMALTKYTPAGELLWFTTFGCPGWGSDSPRAIKVDDDDNVYVTGMSNLVATLYTQGNPVWTTIKYDPSGEVLWVRYYDRPGHIWYISDLPCGIEFDKSGNVLVAGQALESSLLGYDYILLKYDGETGKTLDTYFYYNISGGNIGINDFANAMAMDKSGNIFITGTIVTDSTSSFDFATLKLAPLANTTSLTFEKDSLGKAITDLESTSDTIQVNTGKQISSEFVVSDISISIDSVYHTNDSDLEFYLIHKGVTDTLIYHSGGNGDHFVRTTLDDSSPLLLVQDKAPSLGTYKPYSPLSVFKGSDPDGEWILKIYDNATGNTGVLYAWKLQLRVSKSIINTIGESNLHKFEINQNYPNPFTTTTTISWHSAKSSRQTLKVYDVFGNEVATLVDEIRTAGRHSVDFNAESLPAGVYFYQLQANGRIETKKMIIYR
jgi:hypothetical protein